METVRVQSSPRPTEHEKALQWGNKIEIIGRESTSRPRDPVYRPSDVSKQETSTDEAFEDNYTPTTQLSTMTWSPDESIWAKKTILCLDGGGVRAYSSLLILREVMGYIEALELSADSNAISSAYSPLVDRSPDENFASLPKDSKPSSQYLPCHYFDYIGGTSTGGLSAILLGRLRMSVDEAIDEYEKLSAKNFGKSPSRLMRSVIKYNSSAKHDYLKAHFEAMRCTLPSYSEKSNQFNSDPDRCRTIVCSIKSTQNKDIQTPFLFRSYDHTKSADPADVPLEENPFGPHTYDIWQVARATLAAPSFFKSVKLFDDRYRDATEEINNPSLEVVKEVCLMSGGNHDAIEVLLSIGSGKALGNVPKTKFGSGGLLREITKISAVVDRRVKLDSEHHLFSYCRLEVQEGLQEVDLDEWKPKSRGHRTIAKIRAATNRYLGRADVEASCRQCAATLVRKRTQRAQTMRWERFATGTRYKCPVPRCPTPNTIYQDRNGLMDHLRMQHNHAPPDVKHYNEMRILLDKGRT